MVTLLVEGHGLRGPRALGSVAVERGVLVVTPLVVVHGLRGPRAPGSVAAACGQSGCGSWALDHRPSGRGARGSRGDSPRRGARA